MAPLQQSLRRVASAKAKSVGADRNESSPTTLSSETALVAGQMVFYVGVIMRNFSIVGAAAAALLIGAVGNAEAANPNVPQSSPYTMMEVDSSMNGWADGQPAPRMVEGRSAYVEGDLRVAPTHRMVTGGDDIVVHTHRSYLDPGPSAEVGTENRYFSDTAHYSLNEEGPAFTRNQGGFENLPGQFGPN